MTTPLIRTLPLAVFLLSAASGCEFIQFESPIDDNSPPSDIDPGDGGPLGPQPLYPFRPGSTWQYTVTALDGSKSLKFVSIDKQPVMVGGFGTHQLDMAYPVRTSHTPGGQAYLVRMQQAVGDRVVNYREGSYDHFNQLVLDVNWDPQQLEIDQSSERTRPGVSWQESYKGDIRHLGGMVSSIKRNETWRVVGQEMLALPGIDRQFQTTVFQKLPATPEPDGGAADAGRPADAGDAAIRPPMVTGLTGSEGFDSGAMLPKTLWYARGYGKVKEAGGGEPTEELSGLELK
jgi:hypothetical protein